MNKNIALTVIFLLLSLIIFSTEVSERRYNRGNYNITCSNKENGCHFMVSSNFPISPKIPTSMPTHAILGPYRYIYLIFTIPREQKQKSFYLEAYDTSNEETIISNGDCYFINTTENDKYEIRIYKQLEENSFVRLGFLGLPKYFSMEVYLHFKLSLNLYFNDIYLTNYNSKNKSEEKSLEKYLEEIEPKKIEQKKRQIKAKEKCKEIMIKLFKTTININLFDNDLYMSSLPIVISPYLLATVSYGVGLELSTENIFQPEETILSEANVINGNLDIHLDSFELLNGKVELDNQILKLIDSFMNKNLDIIKDLGFEGESYSLTVSFGTNSVTFTFRYYFANTKKIYYEIEIKIDISPTLINNIKKKTKKFFDSLDEKEYTIPERTSIDECTAGYAIAAALLVFGIGLAAGGLPGAVAGAAAFEKTKLATACLIPIISIFAKNFINNNNTVNNDI